MANSFVEIVFNLRVAENNSCVLEFDLYDKPPGEGGVTIPNSAITSAVYDLFDHVDAIINNRNAVDVSTKFDALGHFQYLVVAADNVIIANPATKEEDHWFVLTVVFTTSAGTHQFQKNFRITVENNLLK